jgi:anti-sigma regulatory factor (Ser/Thr protein kinase)
MRELSLHVLDLVENAIEAGAQHVDLSIVDDLDSDRLSITIRDDGRGMDAQTVLAVRDPFFTTRTTRHVGLGIPLFAAAAERCAGALTINSAPGKGTTIEAVFQHSHIDRAPLGDMPATLMCILMRDRDLDVRYVHRVSRNGAESAFELDTAQIRQELDDVPLHLPSVRHWLGEYIAQGELQLKENLNGKAKIT